LRKNFVESYSEAKGVDDSKVSARVTFKVADANARLPFDDDTFDRVNILDAPALLRRSEMFIAGVLFNDVRSGRSEMFTCACIALLRSAVFLRIAKAINMLLLRSKSRCVKYVDARLTV
jgi:hypothetical protein